MRIDLDKIVFVTSEYRQYHGEGVYKNRFAEKAEGCLNVYLELSQRDALVSGPAIIDYHNNREVKVKVSPNVRGRHVYYFHDFFGYDGKIDPNVGYMALFTVADAIAGFGRAESMTFVLPYIPYLRSDFASESRVAVSAKNFASLIEKASLGKLHHIITFDYHASQEAVFYQSLRPDDLPFRPVIANRFKDTDGQFASVALDEGGAKRARKLAKSLAKGKGKNHIPLILLSKYRPRDGDAEITHVVGDPSGKICVALEDIIDTGGTAIEGANALFNAGAKDVYICATHGLFSPKYEKGKGEVDPLPKLRESKAKIIISDTVSQPDGFLEQNRDIVEVHPISPIVARAIYEIETRGSLSKLYDD